MAQKDKKAAIKKSSTTVRIKAAESGASRVAATPRKTRRVRPDKKRNMFVRIGGYFKGSWTELRQVHWPNRRATWGLTIAVLLYSAFFVVLILLLDAGFKYLFDQILK